MVNTDNMPTKLEDCVMDIDQIVSYVAGFVGAQGGKVELRTFDIDKALAWTMNNKKVGELAVMKGVTRDDRDYEERRQGYIAEHLVEDVIAFSGEYTRGFMRELSLKFAA